jgi:WXG100 family type VII secretion target
MSDADDLVYNYGGISTIAGAIDSFVGQMRANLDEVDTEFKNLIAHGWTGSGSDAFNNCSSKWHAAAEEMAQTLNTLKQKVDNAGIHMHATDGRVATRFGG